MKKFYQCSVCGQKVLLIEEGAGTLTCCGKPMDVLTPNTVDASHEKHVPTYTVSDDILTVKVGSDPHPMTDEHHISWISVYQNGLTQSFNLSGHKTAAAVFMIEPEIPFVVYAYCNLHGLWSAGTETE